jgi:hypothetical protein
VGRGQAGHFSFGFSVFDVGTKVFHTPFYVSKRLPCRCPCTILELSNRKSGEGYATPGFFFGGGGVETHSLRNSKPKEKAPNKLLQYPGVQAPCCPPPPLMQVGRGWCSKCSSLSNILNKRIVPLADNSTDIFFSKYLAEGSNLSHPESTASVEC